MNIAGMPQVSVATHYNTNRSVRVQTEIRREPQATTEIKTTTDTRTTSKITQEKRRIENEIKALSNEREMLDRLESQTRTEGRAVDVVV